MVCVAVDKDGSEVLSDGAILKNGNCIMELGYSRIVLPDGSIEKLIGKKLTWEDEPVELKDDDVK